MTVALDKHLIIRMTCSKNHREITCSASTNKKKSMIRLEIVNRQLFCFSNCFLWCMEVIQAGKFCQIYFKYIFKISRSFFRQNTSVFMSRHMKRERIPFLERIQHME